MAEIFKGSRLMHEGQGFRARAHHLVGVATLAVAPRATGIRRITAPRASRRSSAGVDAARNRRPGLYTPDRSGSAWMQNFNNGNQNNNNKNNRNWVRAVRK